MRSPLMMMLLLLAFAGAGLAGACAPPSHCDPGQTDMGYSCYSPPPPPSPDAAASDTGGGPVDVIPPDSVMCTDQYTGFGYACNSVDDCPCGLDFCVIYGGQTYCTRTGCAADPSVCAQGYSCVDLSPYGPGLKPTCMKM
jgi:hypothetical protein